MLSCFCCRQNLNRNKCPRGCVITRANAAGSNAVRSSTKIKAAGGYMTMGGYQTVGFTVDQAKGTGTCYSLSFIDKYGCGRCGLHPPPCDAGQYRSHPHQPPLQITQGTAGGPRNFFGSAIVHLEPSRKMSGARTND
jgi:hypothetical protein